MRNGYEQKEANLQHIRFGVREKEIEALEVFREQRILDDLFLHAVIVALHANRDV
jgi:hypothetical protein